MFDRTNAQDRFLLKGSIDLGNGFTPELLAYHDNVRTRLGANLAESIGQSVVAYVEWSGGPRASLIGRGAAFRPRERTVASGRARRAAGPGAPGLAQRAGGRGRLHDRPAEDHVQYRVQLQPGRLLGGGLEQLVPGRPQRDQPVAGRRPALDTAQLRARPSGAGQPQHRFSARKLGRCLRSEA